MKSSQLSLLALLAMVGCESRSNHLQASVVTSMHEWSFPEWSTVKRIPLDTALLARYPELVGTQSASRLFFQTFRRNARGLSSPDSIYELRMWPESSPTRPVAIAATTSASSVRVTGDQRDVMHMAFGRANDAKADGQPVEAREVLYSKNIGGKWSEPTSLFKSRGGVVVLSSPLVVARDGSLHLAWFVVRDSIWSRSGPSVLYRRWQPLIGWSDLVRIGTGLAPSLQTTPSGDLYLSFVRTGINTPSALQTFRSSNSGATWTLVDSTEKGTGSITALRLVSSNSGQLAAIWGVDLNGDGIAETFYSKMTSDGTHWSKPAQVFQPNGGISFSFDARFDASGKLYLVFDRSIGLVRTPRSVQECIYDDGSWHGPHEILGLREVSTGVKLAQLADGKLYLSLYAADTPGGQGMAIASVQQPARTN